MICPVKVAPDRLAFPLICVVKDVPNKVYVISPATVALPFTVNPAHVTPVSEVKNPTRKALALTIGAKFDMAVV